MAGENLSSLQPGTVIAGRYEVVKCLGAGSMGLVYACRHRELAGHLVAVKVLFPEVARDEVAAARFRNEIVASYGVSHPNVVRAYEYFRDGELVAYTMEYVGGGDLADRLNEGALPLEDVISYLGQIASGVQAIHDAGIVHRDLKPENILITPQGDVKITDFGIARMGHGPKLTEHGGVVGTIDYVSPEYLEKGQVDARSDIYALGVLGYEMITGESPFRGDSVIATMTMRLKTDPPEPSSLRSECPPQLDKIILKALARIPEDRYQRSVDICVDLQPLLDPGKLMDSSIFKRTPSGSLEQGSDSNNSSELISDQSPANTAETTDLSHSLPRSPTISSGKRSQLLGDSEEVSKEQDQEPQYDPTQTIIADDFDPRSIASPAAQPEISKPNVRNTSEIEKAFLESMKNTRQDPNQVETQYEPIRLESVLSSVSMRPTEFGNKKAL